MPRKAAPKADAANADGELAPRRSSRIKEQPKAEAPKKATKPRGKKGAVTKAGADGEGAAKPPAARGRKRKVDEKEGEEGADAAAETNGDAEAPTDEPAAKKVCLHVAAYWRRVLSVPNLADQGWFETPI